MGEEVSWMFQGCFKSFSKKFQENVQGVSKVSCCMELIAASRAEGGLVYTLTVVGGGCCGSAVIIQLGLRLD